MDRIRELLARLNELSPDEMAELQQLIDQTFDEISDREEGPSAESVAILDELVNAGETVVAENQRREAEAAEIQQKAEEARARMKALREPEAQQDDGEAGQGEGAEPAPQAVGSTNEPERPAAEEGEPAVEPIAASAGTPRGTVGGMIPRMAQVAGRAEPGPETSQPAPRKATIVAAAGIPMFTPGEPLTDPMRLAEATSEKLRRLQASHDFQASTIATATWEYPPERQLGDDASVNTARMEAVAGLHSSRYDRNTGALVATGGVCLPVNVDYSIPTWATEDRPLRDALPAFQATRGGIRYVTPPDIGVPTLQGGTASGAGTATIIWTEANDANPTTPPTKPVWTVACGTEQLVYVNAIPTRIKFGNMQSRFQPEMVAANTEVAMSVAAREAELELLTLMYSASKQIAPKQFLGASRDILSQIDLLAAQYRYSHRIPKTTSMIAVFPAWACAAIRSDLTRETAHDNAGSRDVLAVTDAEIEDWFNVRGITPIFTYDGLQAGTYGTGGVAITNQYFPLATAGAQPQWPGQAADAAFMLAWLLYVEGTFQFLDGGRLDFGVVRDSVLDATNDYETFVELFEGLAFRGLEAYQVQSMILPNGASASTGGTYHN